MEKHIGDIAQGGPENVAEQASNCERPIVTAAAEMRALLQRAADLLTQIARAPDNAADIIWEAGACNTRREIATLLESLEIEIEIARTLMTAAPEPDEDDLGPRLYCSACGCILTNYEEGPDCRSCTASSKLALAAG